MYILQTYYLYKFYYRNVYTYIHTDVYVYREQILASALPIRINNFCIGICVLYALINEVFAKAIFIHYS